MIVREITRAEAKPFVVSHHYSGTMPKTVIAAYGMFGTSSLGDELMLAVVVYGTGPNRFAPTSFAKLSGWPVHRWNCAELMRLCRTGDPLEPLPRPMTWFISRAHKLIRSKGIRYVISYSDPEHGHDGGIYRAANFRHMGRTDPEWHGIDRRGRRVTRRSWWQRSAAQGLSAAEARAALGIEMVVTPPKDRWIIDIDPRHRPEPWD